MSTICHEGHIDGELLEEISAAEAQKLFEAHRAALPTHLNTALMLATTDGRELAFECRCVLAPAPECEAQIRPILEDWFSQLWRASPLSVQPIVVSWSSREAEMGGSNWAHVFAEQIFGDVAGVSLVEDLHCADIFVYRAELPYNFG
eukprot:5066483-Amphidinium_carterae.1